MTYQEFTEISGQEISFEDYDKIVEPMYMGSNMNKYDFCKFIAPSVKPLAKAYKEAQEKKNWKPVFVSDGTRTPNGCYYMGHWFMMTKKNVSISTGKTTYTLRELTDEEQRETGWDEYLAGWADIWSDDPMTKVIVK